MLRQMRLSKSDREREVRQWRVEELQVGDSRQKNYLKKKKKAQVNGNRWQPKER